jgi:hypothetical protein
VAVSVGYTFKHGLATSEGRAHVLLAFQKASTICIPQQEGWFLFNQFIMTSETTVTV